MESTELDPVKRQTPGTFIRSELPLLRETRLPSPLPLRGSFAAALSSRRSADTFTRITVHELATWVYYTASVQAVNANDSNQQHRFVASFGALHPAQLVFATPNQPWSIYIPLRHALAEIEVDPLAAEMLWAQAQRLFPAENATLIVLLSDADLANHYYVNPWSLMLRDAGVLLGHAALVAATLGLGFRILGATGGLMAQDLLSAAPFKAAATGLAWIGGSGLA